MVKVSKDILQIIVQTSLTSAQVLEQLRPQEIPLLTKMTLSERSEFVIFVSGFRNF